MKYPPETFNTESAPGLGKSYLQFLKQVHVREREEKHQAYSQALGRQIMASLEAADKLDLNFSDNINRLGIQLNHRSARARRKAEEDFEILAGILAEEDEEFSWINDHFEACQEAFYTTSEQHRLELNQARERTHGPLMKKAFLHYPKSGSGCQSDFKPRLLVGLEKNRGLRAGLSFGLGCQKC